MANFSEIFSENFGSMKLAYLPGFCSYESGFFCIVKRIVSSIWTHQDTKQGGSQIRGKIAFFRGSNSKKNPKNHDFLTTYYGFQHKLEPSNKVGPYAPCIFEHFSFLH